MQKRFLGLIYDVVILGAGASVLMTGITAKARGKSVCILDHAGKIGQKIRISGGGRCNFTNLNATVQNYLSENPKFCLSALSQYTPADFLDFVEKDGLTYSEKKPGQLFCAMGSGALISLFETTLGEDILFLNTVIQVVEKKDGIFLVKTNKGYFESRCLIVATGGLSYPQMGATDFGYRLATQFGHSVKPVRPALDALILNQNDLFKGLSGLSVPVSVQCKKVSFTDDLLFTHRGLSGPVVLQISSYWETPEKIDIDFSPHQDLDVFFKEKKRRFPASLFAKILSEIFPVRLAEYFMDKKGWNKTMQDFKDTDLNAIARNLHHWQVSPTRMQGFETAEVTRGGVDTKDISSQTMESKKVKGLFFVGEVLDVTGHLGGYNLQWAWSSGFVAGQNV